MIKENEEKIKKLFKFNLRDIYVCKNMYINKEDRKILESSNDIRAKLIIAMDDFNKSEVIVNIKGERIKEDTKEFNHLVDIMNQIVDICIQGQEELDKHLEVNVDEETYSTCKGLLGLCYANFGYLYSGMFGKITLDKMDEAFRYFDKCNEVNDNEADIVKWLNKDICKEKYFNKLEEQINGRTQLQILRESVSKSKYINPYPNDPDLFEETLKGDKK